MLTTRDEEPTSTCLYKRGEYRYVMLNDWWLTEEKHLMEPTSCSAALVTTIARIHKHNPQYCSTDFSLHEYSSILTMH